MKLRELAQHIGADLPEGGDVVVRGIAALQDAGEDEVSFVVDERYAGQAESTKAAAVIVGKDFEQTGSSVPLLRVDDANAALEKVLTLLAPAAMVVAGIHETAVVATSARVEASAAVGPHAVIGEKVTVGADCVISAGCVVGDEVTLGSGCVLWPNVVVYRRCRLGKNVIINANGTIGADGFGYRLVEGRHRKVPHIGIVVIEDDVEIGANVCVDRAKFGETVIGRGTKIDNLVQVAHNVRIGENCILVAQAGLAGSAQLKNYVMLGGQCAVAPHVTVGEGTMTGGQCGVNTDVGPGLKLMGTPARGIRQFFREVAAVKKLPEMARELKRLRKQIEKDADAENNS